MQIFTADQMIQIYLQAREMAHELFGIISASIWHNVVSFTPSLFAAIVTHDWNTVVLDMLILVGSAVFLYRVILRNPIRAILSLQRNDF